jgi:hypothetical protein
MNLKHLAAAFALTGGAALTFIAAPARAADTEVTCYAPTATVNTGQDSTAPRFTITCTGGSTAGQITYFAYEISKNKTVAEMLEPIVGDLLLVNGDSSITISSNLNDTSGDGWGCGASNCRIIDYVTGY